MIRYRFFIGITLLQLVILAGLYQHSQLSIRTTGQKEIQDKRQIVRLLSLTDLSIWTESRYTRHPSQTDFFTPFQDFPSSLEHFPAGSIMGPPKRPKLYPNKSGHN
jgi:hypothetical protein